MCAEYTIKTSRSELSKSFKNLTWHFRTDELDLRVRGFLKTEEAPVIVLSQEEKIQGRRPDLEASDLISSNSAASGPNTSKLEASGLEVKSMIYSLCPSWSKEFPASFSTYNARLERPDPKNKSIIQKIYDVATWKKPFKTQHCLVPMCGAIESSYFGTHAGQIVKFSKQDNSLFYALGIWDEWINKNNGEIISSFALLTDDPYEFFYQTGHDRSIIVVNEAAQLEWLSEKNKTPEDWFKFIKENRINHQWQAQTDRVMKNGWQKRAPNPLEVMEIERFSN